MGQEWKQKGEGLEKESRNHSWRSWVRLRGEWSPVVSKG